MYPSFLKSKVVIFLIGGLLAILLPSPIDPIHFLLQNWLFTANLNKFYYTLWQIFDWYVLDSLWYVFLIIITWTLHIRKTKTIHILITIALIIGIGAAIGIIFKFLI